LDDQVGGNGRPMKESSMIDVDAQIRRWLRRWRRRVVAAAALAPRATERHGPPQVLFPEADP
jgi:hypothetical protein